jgi:putative oxidoreductase
MCNCTYFLLPDERIVDMNVGLLLLHVFLGAALVAHGLQKLLVFRFGGTAAYVDSLGFRAPRLMAGAVIGSELVGGTLVGLGLLLPLGAALIAATMLVAARTDHRGKGWFIAGAGAEYVATNAIVALALASAGGGRYSLDHALGLQLAGVAWAGAVLIASVVATTAILGMFRRRPLVTTASESAA